MKNIVIDNQRLRLESFQHFLVERPKINAVEIHPETLERVQRSHNELLRAVEHNVPLYGVTTGFGDSCTRSLDPADAEELQRHLVDYLTCGSGALLSVEACRGALLARLKSLSRGFSGVRPALLERLQLFLDNDWIPAIPGEGSLGASGDLVPLAYIGQCVQGRGMVYHDGTLKPIDGLLTRAGLAPFSLTIKEGLALVNGTSAMVGVSAVNLYRSRQLIDLAVMASAWTCLVLEGRIEAFGELVNAQSASHSGQAQIAKRIFTLLTDEGYSPKPLKDISIKDRNFLEPVQDRYSLRCSPQILGPVLETLELAERWVEDELNTSSDNPLISESGELANGGNFYGGYLSHSMDYIKMSLAHIADMCDRQLILIMDDKSNRGLPPNLANWPGHSESKRHLHHGLKGLHQSASALTSEICALSIPNGIFSRSAECHNQDKVSLGMSAANQCSQIIEKAFTLHTLQLICLTQAIDLKGIKLQGPRSKALYSLIRQHVPFVAGDRALASNIEALRAALKEPSLTGGRR